MLKLISCNVFMREACLAIANSPHVIDPEFTELGEHSRSDGLRQLLQSRIDAAETCGKPYDAILLLFGLCGNASVGLQARSTRLVIPRAHDCCTILLGSRHKFVQHFGDAPSTPFSSCGYLERGSYFLRTADGEGGQTVQTGDEYKALLQQYGEEDARFIWEQMHPQDHSNGKAVFIDLPETAQLGHAARFEQKAREAGKQYVRLDGNLHLIRNLIHGDWTDEEYLIIPPGRSIEGVYDHERIMRLKTTT